MSTPTLSIATYVSSCNSTTETVGAKARALPLAKLALGIFLVVQLLTLTAYGQGRTLPGAARTADAAPVGISAGQSSVAANSDVVVPLMITDTTGKNIIAYQFNLVYDPAVLVVTANPVTMAGTISSEMAFAVNPFTPGILRVAVYGACPLSGQGALLNLHFHSVGAIGSSTALVMQEVLVNGGGVMNVATNGRVTIATPTLNEVTISGYVRNAGGAGIPFTHVMLSSAGHNRTAVRTNAEGYYLFTNVTPGQAYTVAVGRRLYGFTPMIVNVTNTLSNVDLIARP